MNSGPGRQAARPVGAPQLCPRPARSDGHEDTGHHPVCFDDAMKAVQEEVGAFCRADNYTKHHTGGVIDIEKGNSF